jgi:hypothetical protein
MTWTTTPETILFPDAAALVIGALSLSVPVVGGDDRPNGPFVHIARGGGIRDSYITDVAQLNVESWHPTDISAAATNAQAARAQIHALAGAIVAGVRIYRVDEFAGPAELPDPTRGDRRVVFTVQVTIRGTAA